VEFRNWYARPLPPLRPTDIVTYNECNFLNWPRDALFKSNLYKAVPVEGNQFANRFLRKQEGNVAMGGVWATTFEFGEADGLQQ
jgi:hypothetical protein